MNDEEKENWSKTREKGRAIYILVEGILKAGIFYAISVGIVSYLFDYGFSFTKVGEAINNGGFFFKFFFHWIFFGLWMGVWNWNQSEKLFKKTNSIK